MLSSLLCMFALLCFKGTHAYFFACASVCVLIMCCPGQAMTVEDNGSQPAGNLIPTNIFPPPPSLPSLMTKWNKFQMKYYRSRENT